MVDINKRIADELGVPVGQVNSAVGLLDEGATVPFIARYRKEMTGGLDDTQLRTLETRLLYLRELEQRRTVIVESVRAQGKLTPDLEQAILGAESKSALEDIYLPFKPKRRTKAQIAREAGLEPLADLLLGDPNQSPEQCAATYLNPDAGIHDPAAALEGARQILMERFAEHAALTQELREKIWHEGILTATLVDGKEQAGAKFADYFAYSEAIRSIPSHRALALLRGRNEDVLHLSLKVGSDEPAIHAYCEGQVARCFGVADRGRAADAWLGETVRQSWRIKLLTRIDLDLKQRLREAAEQEAIAVFARNLKDLLLGAPAGPRVTMGLDPGLRTGVKVAIVDGTGRLLETATLYPHVPHRQWDRSIAALAVLCKRHGVQLISIGNGTASRETDRLVTELMRAHSEFKLAKVVVSEAGASVYSASELAAHEFPDLDVSLRGAVSIARRVQDPLAELVKIEPKAIGVGQYQHDVNQSELARSLDAVVEDCVNAVGVDVNTASVPLLRYVSGLSRSIGQNVVEYRDSHGPFKTRKELLEVPRLGAKAYEQAAGFLRITGGDDPLDASAVHPEAYPVVQRILRAVGKEMGEVLGNPRILKDVKPESFADERFGVPTVRDILQELEKPGRDPRPDFTTAAFREGVFEITDLEPGMLLEGQVTNVANFGAFVDIGVHQDGLVHISQLSDRFLKDPREAVKAGDVVKVRVLEVDVERRRIALSMRLNAASDAESARRGIPTARNVRGAGGRERNGRNDGPPARGAMADALARALGDKQS